MNDQLPFFSIIIPTFARPRQLTSCLQAITRLDYPSDCFEVIVVDDGSPQPMDEVVASFQDWLNIKLIRQANGGPANARNNGATHAKGQFLAFTDDDCLPDSKWLQALAKQLAISPEQMVGGQVVNALTENAFSTATQLVMSYLYDSYSSHSASSQNKASKPFFTTNNFAVGRTQFKELGGFDNTFMTGEDREFCDRWLHNGYQMRYLPEAVVYHAHALTLASFWRQHFNYGRGTFNYRHRRAQRHEESVKVEKIAFYLNLLLYPLSQRKSGCHQLTIYRALLLVVLLFISQLANTCGFCWETINLARKNKTTKPHTKGMKQHA